MIIEPLALYVPLLSVAVRHEFGGSEEWKSYSARYSIHTQDSSPHNLCTHGREVVPMAIFSFCCYSAANYASLNSNVPSLQYQWLVAYLAAIDRNCTGGIVVQFHVLMYCTCSAY